MEGRFDTRRKLRWSHWRLPWSLSCGHPYGLSVQWPWGRYTCTFCKFPCTYDDDSDILQNEIIKPTIEGVLSIIRSCAKAKTVKKLVFTSSAGTVNVNAHENQLPVYDESHWSDLDFIYSKKMTAWVRFLRQSLIYATKLRFLINLFMQAIWEKKQCINCKIVIETWFNKGKKSSLLH